MSIDIHEILINEFQKRKIKNPRYSLRKYAQDMGVSAATMSMAINKKLTIGDRIIQSLITKLQLTEEEITALQKKDKKKHWSEERIKYLTPSELKIYKTWYFFAIWETITMDIPNLTTEKIAHLLDIKKSEAQEAIDLLIDHKLISFKDDRWETNYKEASASLISATMTTTEQKKHQIDFHKKCIDSIENDPVELRDNSTVIVAMNPQVVKELKEKIKVFRRHLARHAEKASGSKRTAIYHITIGLNPLTKK